MAAAKIAAIDFNKITSIDRQLWWVQTVQPDLALAGSF